MRDILDLHIALRDAGLDISGVSDPGESAYINGWNSPPSESDLLKAESIIKEFDWTDPAPPATAEMIRSTVQKLTPQQKQKLLDDLLFENVRMKPRLLEHL